MSCKKLTVWIFQTGEPLHSDNGNPRAMRAMNLADALLRKGHRVVIWSSAFFHQEKKHRSSKYSILNVKDDLEIRLIPSCGYRRNIGFGRLIDHAQLSFNLWRILRKEICVPDVAFVGYPPIEFSSVATSWLADRKVPTYLDAKDQWPQIFVEPFPSFLQPLVKLFLFPYFHIGRKAMRNASALTSMSSSFLNWMRNFSRRQGCKYDGVFPLSPMTDFVDSGQLERSKSWWTSLGVSDDGRARFFFVGSLSRAFNFLPILDAVLQAKNQGYDWQFVICGDGAKSAEIRKLFFGFNNVVFPGWVDRDKIIALSSCCTAGLAPYVNTDNFTNNIPNKIIDYLSLAQPVISSLNGEVAALILNDSVGLSYSENDSMSLFNCLMSLSCKDGLRERLSNCASKVYSDRYCGEKVYSDLVSSIELLATINSVES